MNTDYLKTPNEFAQGKLAEYAYREMGAKKGIPLVMLTHLSATLDNWDPQFMDNLAKGHWLIAFDSEGVGLSSGETPTSIQEMADSALDFIDAMNLKEIDLLGFSMGGMIAQELIEKRPELVRKLILIGTGPRGGPGLTDVTRITYTDMAHGTLSGKDPKTYLFFTRTENGKEKAAEFLSRIKSRGNEVKDKNIRLKSFEHQLKAIHKWGEESPADLSKISQPTLIINGDDDRMVPTVNSYDMEKRIPNSRLKIYPDAGHGSPFQFPNETAKLINDFLNEGSLQAG